MIKIIIEFDTENEAYRNSYDPENLDRIAVAGTIERTASKIAHQIRTGSNKPIIIKEINGNRVGRASVKIGEAAKG